MHQTPNKKLGQHFLIEPVVIRDAIQAANVQAGDLVLEVGPGLGVLTNALLDQGANVIAIEKDRAFADRLIAKADSHLNVIQGDAAHLDWIKIISSNPHALNWKFIANIPYAITSLLLRKALWETDPPSTIVVLIQKEVADRCLALMRASHHSPSLKLRRTGAPRSSLLSLMIALSCSSANIIRKVPPNCFYPPPKVDSALLELIPMTNDERRKKWGIDPEQVMKVAKIGFAHPRKQLASNLMVFGPLNTKMSKQDIEQILKSIKLNPKIRAEELSAGDWVEVTKMANGLRPTANGKRSSP